MSIEFCQQNARQGQANRLFSRLGSPLTKLDLMTIEAEDIKASRVFDGEVEGLDPSLPLT